MSDLHAVAPSTEALSTVRAPGPVAVQHAPTTPWERSFTDLVGVAGIAWLAHEKVVTGTAALGAILLLLLPTAALRMIARALGTRLSAAGGAADASDAHGSPVAPAPAAPSTHAPAHAAGAPVAPSAGMSVTEDTDRAPRPEVTLSARREERA